jgi:WD40 repeat protein
LGFNTIAGYCTGRHLPQLSVRKQFQELLTELGVPPGQAQDVWLEALTALTARTRQADAPMRNPYRGLRAFEAEDAADFFGRKELTAKLLGSLTDCRTTGLPLVVVGPSGSGKSSLLRAGLLPEVEASVLMTPGADPLQRWTRTAPVPDDVVLVVDQFEELFTLCVDERERVDFLTVLMKHRGPVVLGLRADFYDTALRYPQLAELLQHGQVLVTPMTEAQLRQVIVEPARSAGLELENGLVELLLRDTARESGALPLLSHTLQTIVELARCAEPPTATIGVGHYQAAGGVHGAIAKSADLAYKSLTVNQRREAAALFLRLVKTDDSIADTRRPVTFDELFDGRALAYADDLAEIIDVFITHRLLTVDTQTVEICHEALLSAWPQLQDWLDEDRAGRRIHGKLTETARGWREDGRPTESLYQGSALAAAAEWADQPGHREALNALEQEFLTASQTRRLASWAAERRRIRRGYQLVSSLVVLVLVAAGASLYARQVATSADHQAQLSLSRQIAGTANRLRQKDPALAAQLALTSYRVAPTADARAALLDSSATAMPRRMKAAQALASVIASAGTLMAMGTDTGQVQLWRIPTAGAPTRIGTNLTINHAVAALTLSNDGTLLAAGDQSGTVSVWHIDNPAHPIAVHVPQPDPGRLFGLAFSNDDSLLAAGVGNTLTYLWHLGTNAPPVALKGPRAAVKSVVFSPNGHLLAAGGDDDTVHMWDVSVAERPLPLPSLTGPTSKIFAIAISPDNGTLAAGTAADHAIYTWDIADPKHPRLVGMPLAGPASWINTVAFSPDGTTLAGGSSDTFLWLWNLKSRQVIETLPHPAPLTAVTYRDGHTLNSLAGDGIVRIWNLPGPILTGSTNQDFSVSFNAAGTRLLVGAGDGSLHLWDVTDRIHPVLAGPLVANAPGSAQLAGAAVLTPDGATAIGGATDGSIHLWNVSDPRHPVSLGPSMMVAHRLIESIAVSRDGKTVAVSSDDDTVHLIDLSVPARPVIVATLTGPTSTAFGVAISPDGHFVAVAGGDAKGYLWDISDHAHARLITTVTGFNGAVYAVAFSADGTLAAFGGADYSVRLVELARSREPKPLPTPLVGPVGEIYDVAFAPNSNRLAISSIDGTVWLWNLRDPGKPVLLSMLQAASGGLFAVAFNPDGRGLAAGGSSNTVQLWDTDTDSVASWICKNTGDPITLSEWSQFIPGQPYEPPCQ